MKLLRRQIFPSAERGRAGKLRIFCVCVVNAVMLYDALFILPPEQEETGNAFASNGKGYPFRLLGRPPNPRTGEKRRPNAMPEAWRLCGQQAADK